MINRVGIAILLALAITAANAATIQLRRDTAANWASSNPTLAAGEIGVDLTNSIIKVGDGSTAWASLAVYGSSAGWDGDIADINLDGGTDIGADLADADLLLVDDGAGGANRKSAVSRVWTYILSKLQGALDLGGATSLEIPNGANPTTDAAGEIAVDTSTGAGQGIRAYGAAAFTLPAWQNKCVTINAATAASDFMVFSLPYAITVRQVTLNQIGATNVIGQWDECDSAGASCSAAIDSTDLTATTTKASDTAPTNAGIDAGDVIAWRTTSVLGTNTQAMACIDFTVDQVN